MDFKIDKVEFLRGLYLAHGIADRKSTLPILANVLLRTEGKDRVLCGATDLSVTAMSSLSARIEKEGGLTVAARQLYEIVKGLPGEEVRVRRTEQNWAEIRAGKVEFKVVGHGRSRLPQAAERQGGRDLQRRSRHAARHDRQDHLLGVAGRNPPASVGRALRVGRVERPHGLHRRPPVVQGGTAAARGTEAAHRDSDSRARASWRCGGPSRRARPRARSGCTRETSSSRPTTSACASS